MPKLEKRGIEKLIQQSKRGQISVFIIIGILILVGAGFYITSEQKAAFAGQEGPGEAIEDVPFDVGPVHAFVQTCLQQISAEAIIELGQHAGYIDPTTADYHNKAFTFDPTNTQATDTDSLTFSEGWYVPYWHYMNKPNNAESGFKFTSNTPTGADIENQVNTYVEKNLDNCLGSFSLFATKGFQIVPKQDMEARTFLTKNAVVVDLKYPLKITKGDSVFEIKAYRASHDVALGKILDFSEVLTEAVTGGDTFERVVIESLASYGRLDGPIPPFSATSDSGGKKSWQESEVKKHVEAAIAQNIDIPLQGSGNYQPLQDAVPFMNSLRLPQEKLAAKNVDPSRYEVNFMYMPTWSTYFDIVKGETIGPKMAGGTSTASQVMMHLGSIIPMNMYNYETPYDISMPILVEVIDNDARIKNPNSLKDKGYRFYYALEANVRDNEPLTTDYVPKGSSQGYSGGFAQFCNPDQRTSGLVTITVKDKVTNKPLNAELAFNSGTGCGLGTTDANGQLSQKFPRGIGSLAVTSPGYLPARVRFASPKAPKTKEETVALHPLIEKKIRVKKYNYDKGSGPLDDMRNMETKQKKYWTRQPLPVDLQQEENVMITFERIADDGSEYAAFASVVGTADSTVLLAPGKYKITMLTQLAKPITIPKCRDCICTGMVPSISSLCARWKTLEGVDMSSGPFMESNLEFVIIISPDMLQSAKPLELYTFVLNMDDVSAGRHNQLSHYDPYKASASGSYVVNPLGYELSATAQQKAIHRIRVSERMVTDLEMLQVISEDAKTPEGLTLLTPRLVG